MTISHSPKILRYLTILCIAWFIFLCLLHLAYQRPLWNDEECVLNSVKAFTAQEMFGKQLLNVQVFPRIYLFLIQKVSSLFDFSLWSLRLLPFVSMILGFLVWLKLARYELKNDLHYLTFILCWLASAPLIYYSAELKQYSMDVLASALIILLLCRLKDLADSRNQKFIPLLIVLPILALFSYPALFLMVLVLYNLFILSCRDGFRTRPYVIVFGVSLLVIVTIAYFIDLRYRHEGVVTAGFNDYFIHLNSPYAFLKTFTEGINNLFTRYFAERPRTVRHIATPFVMGGFLYMFYAFFKNFKKEQYLLKSLNTIPLAIFVILVIVGALKKYPFTVPRTSLFFAPMVMLLTVKAVVHLNNVHRWAYRIVYGGFLIFVIVVAFFMSKIALFEGMTFQPHLW